MILFVKWDARVSLLLPGNQTILSLNEINARWHFYVGWSMFIGQMPNVTVSTGREAVFTCIIDNVYNFKVSPFRC